MADNFKVEIRSIESVKPYDNNPRLNDKAVDAVASSLKAFGFRQPIVVDANGVIVCGHTRYRAAMQLGLTQVPVHLANDLTPEQVKAYRIADNKTGEIAEWDFDILPIELAELQDANFDMTQFGFSEKELAKLLESDLQQGLTDPDSVPATPIRPITQTGDLWILGNHRLYCGNSIESISYERLMENKKATLLLTDPPYNVDYSNKNERLKRVRKSAFTYKDIENDKQNDDAFLQFLTQVFSLAASSLAPGGVFYIWHADAKRCVFQQACERAQLDFRQNLIWNKSHFVIGRQDYQWKHEPCLYGWKHGGAHYWNGGYKQMKPVALFNRLIQNSSKVGDIVLDPFAGSGTSIIACEQTNRRCFSIEIGQAYCDVIVNRYMDFTGKEAIQIHNEEERTWTDFACNN